MINLSKTFNFPPRFLENSSDPFLRLLDVRGFDQCVSGKRNLLVTVGDSWTFGGSLWYLVPYAQHLGPQVAHLQHQGDPTEVGHPVANEGGGQLGGAGQNYIWSLACESSP